MGAHVLIVEDEANIRKILSTMLQAEGYETSESENLSGAKEQLRARSPDVILSDLRLGREDGIFLLKWLRDEGIATPFIILTAHGTVDSAVDAMKQGAFDYLSKPFDRTELVRVLKKAVLTGQYQNHSAVKTWSTNASQFPMVGTNEKMQKIGVLIDKVAPTDSTVLITGESGTGKELIAQALHERSLRVKAPFIKINCAAIPGPLMESELFGYERGAFTGAVSSKPGRFELADGGTFFLDEVAEMSVEMQVKLLRVLQDKSFERVGGIRTLTVDVRLITATNKDLDAEVKAGRFRSDLFYRLNVVPISLPPLRERAGDIPLLVAYFVNKFSEKLKKPAPTVSPETLELLLQFPWPGNIRQLENVIERLIVMNETKAISPDQLPDEILEFEEERFYATQGGTLKEQVREATRRIEKRAIEEALLETGSNVTQAARKLNISRKGLQLKMKELGFR